MAEFESVEDAKRVVEALHGSNIYPECCSMKVEFCKKERLTVKRNDDISWDFTIKISEGDEPRVAKRTLLDNPPMEKPMYHNRYWQCHHYHHHPCHHCAHYRQDGGPAGGGRAGPA